MITAAAQRLFLLQEKIPPLLLAIPSEEFEHKPRVDKWSKKEILGHLIDSASNNHQRFVRLQFETEPHIVYDQDHWNRYSHHQAMPSAHLVQFWSLYNRHLSHIMSSVSPVHYDKLCVLRNGEKGSLEFLINDYVVHQEHHLKQIINYTF